MFGNTNDLIGIGCIGFFQGMPLEVPDNIAGLEGASCMGFLHESGFMPLCWLARTVLRMRLCSVKNVLPREYYGSAVITPYR